VDSFKAADSHSSEVNRLLLQYFMQNEFNTRWESKTNHDSELEKSQKKVSFSIHDPEPLPQTFKSDYNAYQHLEHQAGEEQA